MKKYFEKNPQIGALLLIGLISLIFAIFLTKDCDEFFDSLRGVAYEGVALASLVGIFLFTSERIEENRREKHKKLERQKSRDSLVKILSLLCEAYHTGGTFHWTKHVKSAPHLKLAFRHFKRQKNPNLILLHSN